MNREDVVGRAVEHPTYLSGINRERDFHKGASEDYPEGEAVMSRKPREEEIPRRA